MGLAGFTGLTVTTVGQGREDRKRRDQSRFGCTNRESHAWERKRWNDSLGDSPGQDVYSPLWWAPPRARPNTALTLVPNKPTKSTLQAFLSVLKYGSRLIRPGFYCPARESQRRVSPQLRHPRLGLVHQRGTYTDCSTSPHLASTLTTAQPPNLSTPPLHLLHSTPARASHLTFPHPRKGSMRGHGHSCVVHLPQVWTPALSSPLSDSHPGAPYPPLYCPLHHLTPPALAYEWS